MQKVDTNIIIYDDYKEQLVGDIGVKVNDSKKIINKRLQTEGKRRVNIEGIINIEIFQE